VKLWQKIFLLTLALVIILVNSTSLILLKNNHDLAIVREQQTALTRHSYLVSEIQNSIVYTQLVDRTVSLTDTQLNKVTQEVLDRHNSDSAQAAALYQNGTLDYAVGLQPQEAELRLLGAPDYSSNVVSEDGSVYLLVVSGLTLNDRPYQLVSSYDISPTYALFEADFNQVRGVGIISALVIAGILLLMVRMLLNPLRNLSTTTRQIANGDLEKRARVSGNDEVAEVARNLNSMADSIENNVTSLEQLAESRKVFIGNLAHEMKTPLTSILGFADLLRVQREISDSSRQDYAGVIVSETKRLQALSGKLMELLSVGSMQPSLEAVDLNQLANDLAIALQPVFAARRMDLVCELPTHTPVILADQELLRSLVYNLIDNGMKASTEGATNTICGQIKGDGKLRLQVRDAGMGIPADRIPQLTEPFYMLDKARTRRYGGAGLGLALCAEIAKAHGSELLIESELGIGTTVSVDFPLVTEQEEGAAKSSASGGRSRKKAAKSTAETEHV
jgi:signal transduction histidine kinase